MYDNPNRITYRFLQGATLASATQEFAIRGPKGKKGEVWDMGVYGVTTALTTFVNGGAGTIAVGTTDDPDAYADEFTIGGVAAEDAASVRSSYAVTASSTATAVVSDYLPLSQIPADQKVIFTVTESSDGVVSGGVYVTIDWAD